MRWFWIDRFMEFESGRYAKAIKSVSLAEEHLHDHFPESPVLPNSLVIEGLAQTGGLLVGEHNQFTEKVILAKVPKVQFFFHARPGDTLTYLATIVSENSEGAQVTATSHIGDRLQAEAEIFFVHLNAPWLGTFFSPEVFLSMMRVFGAYRVGRAADGSPLVPPARLCHSAHDYHERQRGRRCPRSEAMRRRVVITGIGMVTPLGTDREGVWKRLLAGESGVGYTTLFDASNFPTKISAEVRDWDVSDVGEKPEDWKFQGRHTHFAVGAAKKAVRDAGLKEARIDPTRFGVYLGSGEGQQDFDRFTQMMIAALERRHVAGHGPLHPRRLELLNPMSELEQEPNMPAGHLASLFNAQGPNTNCLTACAASSQAIGEAVEIIRRGDADVMLSGGTHSMIHPFGVTGFNLLTALSTRNDEPDEGLAAVRSRTRRFRAGRRGRHGDAGGTGTSPRPAVRRSTARLPATVRRPTPSASPTRIPKAAAP